MFGKNHVLIGFFALGLLSCSTENKSPSGEDALEAFSKIDKKNENLFTQEDRKNKFKNSIVRNLDKKESLSKNVSYNGYGSTPSKKDNSSNNKKSKKDTKTKKVNYSYQNNSPQTYSTYSTN